MTLEMGCIFGYIILQIAIGAYLVTRTKTETDYFLAGRSLGVMLATFSIFATWFGAEACIGSAGAIFESGLAAGRADPFGYTICLLLMGAFIASRLWKMQLTTIIDLYRIRYSSQVEKAAVLIFVPSSLIWAAAQIRAFGQVLTTAGGTELETGMAIAAGVVILYTCVGGLMADVVTDLVQGIALIVGLVVIFAVLIVQAGGLPAAIASVNPERLRLWNPESGTPWQTLDAWLVPICGSLFAQELISRVLASRSPGVARSSTLLASFLYLSIGLIPVCIGLIGPALIPQMDDPEQLLPTLAKTYLNPVFYILFSGALVSAILSTVDSTLLTASSLFSHNLVYPLFGITDEKRKLRIARGGVVLSGVIALLFALHSNGIYELVEAASALGGSGVVVITLFALFTKFGGKEAAMATLIAGVFMQWFGESWLEVDAPFLLAIVTCVCVYCAVALGAPFLRGARISASSPSAFTSASGVNMRSESALIEAAALSPSSTAREDQT